MATSSSRSRAVLTLLLVACVCSISGITEAVDGFTVDLIHRDSPKSPFFNPKQTRAQRIADALRRSVNRADHFSQAKNSLSSSSSSVSTNVAEGSIVADGGEYLMEIALGTPAVSTMAIADTGSDLIWTQCEPCDECYRQDDPIFDPSKSSTYKKVSCATTLCRSLHGTFCSSETSSSSSCEYSAKYGDGSFTRGDIATETLTFGSTTSSRVVLPKTTIGCGHDNNGTFRATSSGIVGLGGGAASLITQMYSSISGKFSYCLVPWFGSSSSVVEKSSKLNFGSRAVVSGSGTVSTPLVKKDPATFYFLTLEGISVGTNRVSVSREGSDAVAEPGNIIIDSGTTLTFLPAGFYGDLEYAIATAVNATRLENPTSGLSLCFQASDPQELGAPDVTVHFTGADLKLSLHNVFILAADSEVCAVFVPSQGLGIYGNLSQTDFLIGYDHVGQTVSFKPTDCSQQ